MTLTSLVIESVSCYMQYRKSTLFTYSIEEYVYFGIACHVIRPPLCVCVFGGRGGRGGGRSEVEAGWGVKGRAWSVCVLRPSAKQCAPPARQPTLKRTHRPGRCGGGSGVSSGGVVVGDVRPFELTATGDELGGMVALLGPSLSPPHQRRRAPLPHREAVRVGG